MVNFDVAKNIEQHVHRIGRTGRMGLDGVTPGTAHTLVTRSDLDFGVSLVVNREVRSNVPARHGGIGAASVD